ncbi:unnamed protein product [Haemonchus placei]|uniref:General secretion pathway protein G n=1 Tax=Haemonchus placei TaxID=6290 RepID=A0A0N4X1U2_HAEPC|nr:unnamed protein product [Haemonchus placei]
MDKSLGTISVQAQNDMKNLADDPAQMNNPISKEEWASTLFGQRGILSGIFQMLDQQKKIGQSPLNDPAADSSSGKINSNSFDFKRIVDALFKGPDSDTFGDPGPELPETPCGKFLDDISIICYYFPDVMSILPSIQVLSILPIETKEKNSKLTPEDGDFGIEFKDGEESLPDVDFSTDGKPGIPSEDYYEQLNLSAVSRYTAILLGVRFVARVLRN